jgi:hypothetical protein
MSKQGKYRHAYRVALAFVGLLSFVGCESEGPAEKAGKSIDKSIQNAKDAVNPPGPAERAGRNVDEALKP